MDSAAAGANFEKYAVDNCLYFAPRHLKPLMLGMIQDAVLDGSEGVQLACRAMTEYASQSVADSAKPFFVKQLQATENIASTFDNLLARVDPDAGKCTDFEANPYATVLMPEPVDYFLSCSRTSFCALKCATDFDAFDAELLRHANAAEGQASVVRGEQESLFFPELDEDAYTPMHILSMVELSDCQLVCGGETGKDENRDACIAVAGITSNSSVCVKKYCIPRRLNEGVRSQASEEW